ncbi:Carboxylesterase, type B [Beauveria brongniartii RCEF 3172]|uniref:Carboxylesterase, type B n=1 Tax=Beauveria brongniartii RCEF 3172 TaxID=1081107 RepID=A0A162M4X7_9HYPO|nr:Carboxylesterase, type B [Beauveria brongniartii RCEF 3172]
MALVVQTVLAVPSIVTLPYAKYNGLVLSNGVTQWLGMRYAAPPIGDRRFRPPEEPLSETRIQEAKVHGDRCLVTGRPARDPGHGEDCLFINVQAPTHAKENSRLPVFVYLRGDGYNNTLTDANINATGLMVQNDNDFIVVTLNHRLGPYGFLTRGDGMASNNGIRDQIKALDWVTRFIRRFGGNPEQIVLGGSGIGAQNVLIHLTMQKEYNPHFKGIIAESPSFPPLLDLEQADKQYLEFAKQMGCSSKTKPKYPSSEHVDCGEEEIVDCLLALSADDIQNAGHNNTLSTVEAPPWDRWLPVIDYDLIIDTTTNNFKNGHFAAVPFIIGNVVDTGTAFAHRDGRSTDDVIDYMSDLYPQLLPEDLEEINTMYPNTNASCDTPSCAYGQISNVVQDSRYVCPALIATQGMKKQGIEGSYLYLWDVNDKSDGPLDPDTRQNIEAAMLWGPVVVDVPDSFKQGGGNDAVPYVKQRYWTNFVRSLNPNRQHKFQDYKYSMTAADKKIRLTLWPQWRTGGRKRLVFGNGGKNRKKDTGYIKWTCTFWNRLSVRMGI